MFIKHAKSKITQIFNDINEFRGFAKRSSKSSDKSLFTRVANRLKEVELPDDLENYILLRNRAISSMELWGCNQNFDAFPDNELRTKYSTFKNCRIDVDHICDDDERDIIGIVLDSIYVEPKIYRRGRFIDYNESDIEQGDQVIGGYIENLWAIHKGRAEAHTPGLVSGILNAEVTDSSMGCFPSGTPITIENGYKSIEDIQEGDLVKTHIGQLKKVKGLFSKDYTDGLFTIKVQGNGDEFGVTYEHPFLTIRKEELDCTHPTNKFEDASTCHPLAYKNNQCIRKHCNISENKEYKIDWIKTQDLTVGDYVAYVINDDVEHDENESVDFARLLGYYLSDGCYVEDKRNGVRNLLFNFGKHEMQYAEEVIELVKRLTNGYVGSIITRESSDGYDRNDIKVYIGNTVFANKVLDYAGRWSKQKKLNNKVLKWKPENQLELLGTMINGDGCNYKGAVSIEIANYELSQQLIEIASRNRIIWTIQKIKHIANENSVCKTGTESICWQIRFAKTDNEKLSKVTDKATYFQSRWSNRKFYYKNYLFAPINKIEFDENWSGKIYNFEVEDDNSYIANNIAVHNCMVAEAECSVCGKKYADSRGVCTKHIGDPYFEPEFDEYGRQVYKTDANGNKLVDKTGNWIKEGDWLIDYSGKKGQYHIHKGKRKLAFEINHGIEFFEDSVIKSEEFAIKSGSKAEAGGEGADNRAKILEHIPTDGFRETKKKSLLDMIKKVSINESLLKDEYMKLGEEPQDITERKEELQNESVEKLDEGESDKIMTNYGRFEDLVEGNDWNNFKRLVSERIGNNNLKTSQLVGLKNFYKKSLNEKVVFKIKEMRNNRMKDDEITDKLLEMGFDKNSITEGLHYDKHFGVGEVVNSMKKHILEGISLYHKAIIDIPNMDSGMMSDRMDTQKHVDDDEVGQKPIDKDSTNAENNSLGYGKTGEKNSQLNIKVDELESIKSDLLDETKEVDTEDGKIVYNDEELTKKTEQFKHMADKNKDKLNNGRGIERYDGKYNDKEQDLSQKKVNVEDYEDLKETDKEHSTSDSGAVQKDRKLPKKQTDNRIGDSTTDFKESVDGSSKTYPNPYKEDLKTKEMIWKVESLEKMKNLLTASINEEADKKLEENDERRKGFGFENAKDLQKSQEKNNNSDSEGNLSDELDKEYIDTHTDRKKTSAKDKTCPDCGGKLDKVEDNYLNADKGYVKYVCQDCKVKYNEPIEKTAGVDGTDKYKVVACSSNTNSFGLYQMIVINQSGDAWRIHGSGSCKKIKGSDLNVPIHNGVPQWGKMGYEIPEHVENAPQEVINEVWGTQKTSSINDYFKNDYEQSNKVSVRDANKVADWFMINVKDIVVNVINNNTVGIVIPEGSKRTLNDAIHYIQKIDNKINKGAKKTATIADYFNKNENSVSLTCPYCEEVLDVNTTDTGANYRLHFCPNCEKSLLPNELVEKKTAKIATIADYFNQYENSTEETASGNHINTNGIPNDDAISNNIINQAKLTKYADDWSPETNYDKKAEEDFNLGLKPNDDFKVKNAPKDDIIKEGEGGGDYMTPIAKKAKVDYDDDEEIDMWIMNDEGLYNWCYNELVDPDSIGDLSDSAYTNFIDKNRKEIVDAINEKLSITKKSAIDVDDIEDEPTEEGDGFKMDGDEIVDIPENIEEKIKQKEADLINSLTKQKWAILTATKEELAKNTEFEGKAGLLPENLERNEQLKEDIGNMGYNPIEIKGVYQNVYQGDSYLVYDIKLRDAFVLGARYEQENILIPEGLLYTKDITEQEAISYNLQQATLEPVKINPNTGHFEYTMGEEATKEEFYSTFKVGDNMINLSLGLNFKKFIPYWEFPEYVKKSLIEKQKNQKAEDEHIQLDETEGGGTDLLDVDLKGDTTDSVDTTDSDTLSTDDTDSKNESEETPNFDDIKEDDINFDDEDNEPEEKRSKKIVGGALPTNPMDFTNYIGKQVEKRDPQTGTLEGINTIQDLKTIKNDDGTEDVGVITNNNELVTTKDNIMETTSVLKDLMSIKFDDDDLDIEKKTAGIDELSFNITLDDDERFTTTAEAESAMGGEGFFDSISDTETDKSKGETKPMHEKKRGGLGKVNQHADRSKLNRDSLGIDDTFFDD